MIPNTDLSNEIMLTLLIANRESNIVLGHRQCKQTPNFIRLENLNRTNEFIIILINKYIRHC